MTPSPSQREPRPPCRARFLTAADADPNRTDPVTARVCARPDGHGGVHCERLLAGETTVLAAPEGGPNAGSLEVKMGMADPRAAAPMGRWCTEIVYGTDGPMTCGLPRCHVLPHAPQIAPGMAATDPGTADYETARAEAYAYMPIVTTADDPMWVDRVPITGPSPDLLAFMGRMAEVLDPVWCDDDPLPSEDRLVSMARGLRSVATDGLALRTRVREFLDDR